MSLMFVKFHDCSLNICFIEKSIDPPKSRFARKNKCGISGKRRVLTSQYDRFHFENLWIEESSNHRRFNFQTCSVGGFQLIPVFAFCIFTYLLLYFYKSKKPRTPIRRQGARYMPCRPPGSVNAPDPASRIYLSLIHI